MSLSPHATYDDLKAAYHECSDYAEVGSVAKARRFSSICIRLIEFRAGRMKKGSEMEMEFDGNMLLKLSDRAERWIATNPNSDGTGGAVIHTSLENFRH